MSYLFLSTGILNYSGNNRVVVNIDPGICDFYRSMIPKYFACNRPFWPAHITVVREHKEEVVNRKAWKLHEGEEVEFFYENFIYMDETYYWLNIFSSRLEEIRLELGLPCTSPYTLPPEGFTKCFHCTLGNNKGK